MVTHKDIVSLAREISNGSLAGVEMSQEARDYLHLAILAELNELNRKIGGPEDESV